MSFPSLRFISGSHLPACSVHIHSRFPDAVAVQFLRSGSLYFQREDRPRQHWSQPVFFWTDRSSVYRYGPGETGTWDHHWVTFHGPGLRVHLLPLLEDLAPSGIIPVHNAEEVRQRIRKLIERVLDHPGDNVACTHLLHQLLAAVYEGRPGLPSVDSTIRKIQNELESSLNPEVSLEDLARRHGMSYSRFRTRFREQVGTSPAHYRNTRRLREAARRLETETCTAAEIGDQLGYSDPAHFSKAFKKQFGISPRQYRHSVNAFSGQAAENGSS